MLSVRSTLADQETPTGELRRTEKMQGTIASRRTLLALIAINTLFFVYSVITQQPSIDFRAFYFAGETVRRAPASTYDLKYQLDGEMAEFKDMAEIDGEVHYLPFFHPPHELLVFAPLSKLPYAAALNVWRLFGLVCLVLSGLMLAKTVGADVVDTVLLTAAVYPVLLCLTIGQDSLLSLLLLCGCFYLLKRDQNVWAAAVLAVALFKPQLPVVFALAMLAIGKKRFFAWFAVFGFALAAASMAYVRWTGIIFMMAGSRLGEMGQNGVASMPTVRGMLAFAGYDSRWLAIAILAAAIVGMFPVWRRSRSPEYVAASSICLGSALAIYCYPYDLVVLAIPLVIVLNASKLVVFPTRILTPTIAAITSGPLGLLAYRAKMPFLLLLPTVALGYLTARLRGVQVQEAIYAHVGGQD